MSGTGETFQDFGGEERPFRIRLGEIRLIQDKCGGVGIGEVLRRLSRAVYVTSQLKGIEALAAGLEIHADDVREPIYRGLVGGGMDPAAAAKLVRTEIDERGTPGLIENVAVALSVLWGSQEAPEPGEPDAGTGNLATQRNPSTSKSSTGRARPSASRRARSTS